MRKNAFAKEVLQQVGDAECCAEGVGHGRGSKIMGKNTLADEAGDAA